jgi:hypothetical protein
VTADDDGKVLLAVGSHFCLKGFCGKEDAGRVRSATVRSVCEKNSRSGEQDPGS